MSSSATQFRMRPRAKEVCKATSHLIDGQQMLYHGTTGTHTRISQYIIVYFRTQVSGGGDTTTSLMNTAPDSDDEISFGQWCHLLVPPRCTSILLDMRVQRATAGDVEHH